MAGSSKRHNRIMLNCVRALDNVTDVCEIYSADIKVKAAKHKSYFYPDVVVSCEPDDSDDYYLETPCLMVEVLSKSTQSRDRGEKLLAYMSIPSLQAYLLLEQDKQEAQLFYRQSKGDWWIKTFNNDNEAIALPCIDKSINLTDTYKTIVFD